MGDSLRACVRARDNRTSVRSLGFRALAAVCLSSDIRPKCVHRGTPPETLELCAGFAIAAETRIAVAAAAAPADTAAVVSFLGQIMVRYVTVTIVSFSAPTTSDVVDEEVALSFATTDAVLVIDISSMTPSSRGAIGGGAIASFNSFSVCSLSSRFVFFFPGTESDVLASRRPASASRRSSFFFFSVNFFFFRLSMRPRASRASAPVNEPIAKRKRATMPRHRASVCVKLRAPMALQL